jgi:hypothetical protein
MSNYFGFNLNTVAAIIAHAYPGTIANPGTSCDMVDGKVSRLWRTIWNGIRKLLLEKTRLQARIIHQNINAVARV